MKEDRKAIMKLENEKGKIFHEWNQQRAELDEQS